MLYLLIFILSCYGLTQILVYGSIFDKIRPKKIKFFNCPMCIGFWVGVFFSFCFWYFDILCFINFLPLHLFSFGCISSGTSYALCSLFGDYGLRTEKRIIEK